jgi:hypothetical protein
MRVKGLLYLAALVPLVWLPTVSASPLDDRIRELADLDAGCTKSGIALAPDKKELFCACFAGSFTSVEGIRRAKLRKPNSFELNDDGNQFMDTVLDMCLAKYK